MKTMVSDEQLTLGALSQRGRNYLKVTLIFLISFLCSWPLSARAETVELSTGPFNLELLPAKIYSTSNYMKTLFRDPKNGNAHLLMDFVYSDPVQFVDVNLDAGSVRVLDGVGGRSSPNGYVVHPNGNAYIATLGGHLLEYNIQTSSIAKVYQLKEGAQYMTVGDDGALYIGQSTKGYLDRYDPVTKTGRTYGIMDDPGPPYYRYVYFLGADNRYVYCAMGQNPWYLVVLDRQTETQTVFWKNENAAIVEVSKGLNGKYYARIANGATLGNKTFELNGPSLTEVPANPAQYPFYKRGLECSDMDACPSQYGVEVDISMSVPYSVQPQDASAYVLWRSTGSVQWNRADYSVRVGKQPVKQLFDNGSDRLLGIVQAYGPMFQFDKKTETISLLGLTSKSNYDALYLEDKKLWFISGYAGATIKYDPAKPWTLVPGENIFDKNLNPHGLTGIAKYHYYLARGADGMVYVGVHHERDSTGGDLGWYDPDTEVMSHLRDPFVQFDVRDLKPILNGTKLVYSAVSVANSDGSVPDAKLFVFDVATKKIEREIIPLPGVKQLDKIIECEPGIILGVTITTVCKVNALTGEVLFRKNIPQSFNAAASYDRRLIKGPDGYAWFVVQSSETNKFYQIVRMNPANGNIEIMVSPRNYSLYNFIFSKNISGTAYDIYAFSTQNTDIFKIRSVFKITDNNPPPADTQIPTVPSNLTAEAISPFTIRLSWAPSTDNVGITGYKIFKNGNLSPLAVTTAPYYSDLLLTPGTYETYHVSAYDAAGNNSAVSARVTQMSLPQASGSAFFVSPTGTASGDGSFANPWDMQTALNHPASVKPGDTIWLRGGTYVAHNQKNQGGQVIRKLYMNKLNGQETAPITVRGYPGERATCDASFESIGIWTTFWGFEVMDSDTNRAVCPTERYGGFNLLARGNKIINMVIHDTGHAGVGFWRPVGDGGEIYGTLIWGVGIYDTCTSPGTPDKPWTRGSAIYAQNIEGTRYIHNNITFANFTTGMKAYGQDTDGFEFKNNIVFNNGLENLFVAANGNPTKRLRVINNYSFRERTDGSSGVNLGLYSPGVYDPGVDAVVSGNYLVNGDIIPWPNAEGKYPAPSLSINNFAKVSVENNTLIGGGMAYWLSTLSENQNSWDHNTYYTARTAHPNYPFWMQDLATNKQAAHFFNEWKSTCLCDAASSLTSSYPTVNKIVILANKYEAGRGHIAIYNWQLKETENIDLSAVGFSVGDSFEVRDAQNYYGVPVVSGTYRGGSISVPLRHTNPIKLIGAPDVPHSSMEFNAFVYLTKGGSPSVLKDAQAPTVPTQLKVTAVSAFQIHLSWSPSTDNVGVTGYKIYRNSVLIALVPGVTYMDTDLTEGTEYTYVVSSVDEAGNESAHLNPKVGTTLFTPTKVGPSEQTERNTKLNPHRGESIVVGAFLNGEQGTIEIMDRKGTVVRTFTDADSQTVWNGRNQNGDVVSSGIYLVKYPRGQKRVVVAK